MAKIFNSYRRVSGALAGLLAGLLVLAAAPSAGATERQFTYTYGSATLGAGEREIEPWTTFRVGRDGYYSRLENRLELEVGLTDRLQTSWYLNLSTTTGDAWIGQGNSRQSSQSVGVSSEWKYKLLDPVADAVGMALYLEGEGSSSEVEVEAKLILDKRLGNVLVAANLVGAHEWDLSSVTTQREKFVEVDLGAAYFVTPSITVGAEVRDHNVIAEVWESSALFAGPAVSFAAETWWAALTVLPQVRNLKKEAGAGALELHDHEKVNTRLIFGAHF
jgi:hypothetical protein